MLNAIQTHELLPIVSIMKINGSDSIPLTLAEEIIIVLIKFRLDVGSEIGVREVGSVNANGALRDDLHVQGKGRIAALAAVVGVGHLGRALIHLQGAAVHGAANPFADLGHVKPVEGTQVKGAGGRFHIDVDLVVVCVQCRNSRLVHVQAGQIVFLTIQILQCRIFAHVQFRQLILEAHQPLQCWILAHIQTGQLVIVARQILQRCILRHIQAGQIVLAAPQILQRRIFAHIQTGQLVFGAIQSLQFFILAHIQTGQLVIVALQLFQFRILAYIQFRQLVIVAIQSLQVGEELNSFQVCDMLATDI